MHATLIKKKNLNTLKLNAYYNLASSYQKLTLYRNAIANYDTVISLCNEGYTDTSYYKLDALYNKADIHFFLGDYQKAADESLVGMQQAVSQKDSSYYLYFFNRYNQALCLWK